MNKFFNAQNLQGGMKARLVFTSFSGDYVLQDDQGKALTFTQFFQADSFRVFFSYLRERDHECNYQAVKVGSSIVFTLQDRDLKYPIMGSVMDQGYEGKALDYWRAAFSGGKLIYNMTLSSSGLDLGLAYPDKRSSEIWIREQSESGVVDFPDWNNFANHFLESLNPGARNTAGYGYAHYRDLTSGGGGPHVDYGAMVPVIGEEYLTMYLLGGKARNQSEDDFGALEAAAGVFGDEGYATTQVPNDYPDPIFKWDLRSAFTENVSAGTSSKSLLFDYPNEFTFRSLRVVNYSALVFSSVSLNLQGEYGAILNLSFKSIGARETLTGSVVIEGTDYNYPERGTIRKTVSITLKGI